MKANENEIVISGISGRFPESDDIEEFWNNLINGRELYSCDDRRWPIDYLDLPPYSGKIKDLSKIDADFFKLKQADVDHMDPQYRLLYEVVYEAVYDAGK
ncbi:Fatty acid synthase-like protein [Dinothrombium tinctorium]|uniref:Fatty acid synthase-like protein n=1 Tax=Dinothrombium tinctorium TaxID=1965070 RepID=A0A3S3P4Q2_9ACAR|nr:Fatty acid synthase-like protein [Dinothrombium tinctorium]RWS00846.1 Fatty acid synthase-like protein [Dinothrombium tinctorium]RWS04853.1 Fatty acid synthase-like protein [Dinothrombium tinctorium]